MQEPYILFLIIVALIALIILFIGLHKADEYDKAEKLGKKQIVELTADFSKGKLISFAELEERLGSYAFNKLFLALEFIPHKFGKNGELAGMMFQSKILPHLLISLSEDKEEVYLSIAQGNYYYVPEEMDRFNTDKNIVINKFLQLNEKICNHGK